MASHSQNPPRFASVSLDVFAVQVLDEGRNKGRKEWKADKGSWCGCHHSEEVDKEVFPAAHLTCSCHLAFTQLLSSDHISVS